MLRLEALGSSPALDVTVAYAAGLDSEKLVGPLARLLNDARNHCVASVLTPGRPFPELRLRFLVSGAHLEAGRDLEKTDDLLLKSCFYGQLDQKPLPSPGPKKFWLEMKLSPQAARPDPQH